MAAVSFDSLLTCLEVKERAPGRWTAPHLDLDYHRIFGGQLLAQAIAAAAATGDGKTVKSMHAAFPRQGRTEEAFDLEVEAVHDGRSFATRTISAAQDDRPFFVATVSLHGDDAGPEAQMDATELGAPAGGPEDATPLELSMIPWECRAVDGVDLGERTAGPATYAFWTRVADRTLPDDVATHQALAAHATDLTVIGTALRPIEGLSQADAGTELTTAVTSHTLWFHRPFRIDDWCLVFQHSPVTAGGRGFGQGHIADDAGTLVASFAQESMIRRAAEPGPGQRTTARASG